MNLKQILITSSAVKLHWCNLVTALSTGSKKTINLARRNTAVSNMLDIIYNYDTVDIDENFITEKELLDIISYASSLVDIGCYC